MKLRESGMPPQDYWESLFDVPLILDAFGFGPATGDVAELGCGYGTFTLPLAKRIGGTMHAIDIDPAMVELTQARARENGVPNIDARVGDILATGFGLPADSCDAVLLFNILHGEEPVAMLQAAHRVLRPGGVIAVIHWRSDIATPRGPPASIRPAPEGILEWCTAVQGLAPKRPPMSLPPWHYGIELVKRTP